MCVCVCVCVCARTLVHLSMWFWFKCDSRRHHVMVNANTGRYCDLFISLFLPTHTHTHTHTALTWECSFRLNQCHACHINRQRSSLSCDYPSTTHLFIRFPWLHSFSACVFLTSSRPALSLYIPVSTSSQTPSASVPPICFQTIFVWFDIKSNPPVVKAALTERNHIQYIPS